MTVINQPTCRLFTEVGQTTQLAAYYEEGRHTMWMMLRAQPRPSFNHELIEEIMNLSYAAQRSGLPIDFWVTGSLVPQMFNAGGDLRFFVECIRNNRREALRAYARACVDCIHSAARGFDTKVFQPGDSYRTTRTFIDTLRPKLNGVRAMLKARQRVLQLSRAELMDITEDWVDYAFTLEPKDIAYMERLVQLQNRHSASLRKAG